jgi:acyl-CoA thioester hydrolase
VRFFEQVFGVYFDDLDPFHILHNARYLVLFERAVGAFWMECGLGAFQDERRPDQFHLVVRNELDYLVPFRGVGRARVRVWVAAIGRTSLTFGLRLLPMGEDIDHARGLRTIVHVDPTTLTPLPWSDELRATLAPYVHPAG